MKNKKIIFTITTLSFILIALLVGKNYYDNKNNFVADTSFCLNTVIEQKWYGKNAQKNTDEINEMLISFEDKVSSYVENSEINVINQNAGKSPVTITDETYQVLKTAKELSEKSDGSFDITVFPLVNLWGITGDNPKVPGEDEIKNSLKLINISNLILEEKENGEKTAFLKNVGMSIDLGGIAKGMAADMVREIAIKNNVKGYASLGGNLSVVGKKPDGTDFKFGLRNPRGTANEYVGIVTLQGKTMATTGDYERFFEENDKRYHHIFDISTGYPVENDLISVTVVSANGALADCLSTEIFVKGKDKLENFLNSDEYEIIAIDSDYNIYISESLRDNFVFKDDSKKFKFVVK
ncbi:MAG: FAD:protein FMN transferase [Oscillospiraceae bacterium]